MTAYRQGPAPAGLPFPRKALGIYTALTIVAAAVLLLVPGMFASPSGWRMFKEGGVAGMSLILLLSLASSIALGTLGAFAVRGKRMPMMILPAIPALPLLAGVLFMLLGVMVMFGAISGESVDPSQRMRIAAEGIAEADAALVFGCLVGGVACGAAAIALLGSAASVDRAQTGAPAKGKGARPVETLAFVVTPREKPDLTPLGRYAPFVGRDVDTIKVYLAPSEYQLGLGGERRIRPRESDDMQSVIDQMTTSGDRTRLLLLPPEGVW